MHFITENWLVAWFFLLFFLEVLIYKDIILTGKTKKRWGVNVLNFIATKLFSILLIVPLLSISSDSSSHFITSLPYWISIPIGVVLLDLSGYIFHRLSHELEFFGGSMKFTT